MIRNNLQFNAIWHARSMVVLAEASR